MGLVMGYAYSDGCCRLGIFAYLSGHVTFSRLSGLVPYLPNAGELIVFCAALVAPELGFLWLRLSRHGVYGGCWRLALGGGFSAIMAVLVRQEIVLMIMGACFCLWETFVP